MNVSQTLEARAVELETRAAAIRSAIKAMEPEAQPKPQAAEVIKTPAPRTRKPKAAKTPKVQRPWLKTKIVDVLSELPGKRSANANTLCHLVLQRVAGTTEAKAAKAIRDLIDAGKIHQTPDGELYC